MQRYGIVFVTVGKEKEAIRISNTIVSERLAACVNIVPQIQSFYTWKGKLVKDKESLLIIKTRANLFNRLKKRILSLHSYEVPEIIFIPIQKGLKSYLDWIGKVTRLERQSNLLRGVSCQN